MSEFSELFSSLLGTTSTYEFAVRSKTSQAAVYRASTGGAIAAKHLGKWAAALSLGPAERARFIALGEAAKLLQSKRNGSMSGSMEARAVRAEDALLSFFEVATKHGLPVPESVRQTIEAIRQLRGL